MPKNIREVIAWSKTHDGKKIIRFGLSSVITTSVSFLGIVISYGFHLIHGVLGATLFGNLVAVIPGYYLSRSWAWGKKGKSHIRKRSTSVSLNLGNGNFILIDWCLFCEASRAHSQLAPLVQYVLNRGR